MAVTLVSQILLLDSDANATACLDTGCGVTLVDKAWLLQQLSNQKIKGMSTPLKIKGIGGSKHKSAQFAKLSFFFLGENDKRQKVYASLSYELYLVEGFRANILIENNILVPKGFIFDLKLGHASVGSCGVKIIVRARQRSQFLRRKLFAETNSVVSLRSEAIVLFYPISLPDNKDFLFYPVAQVNLTIFAHLVDYETTKVLVRNTSDRAFCISRWQRLGHVVNICYDNYFFTQAESVLQAAAFPPKASPFFKYKSSCTPDPTNPSMEMRLDNSVRVYGDK